MVRTRTHSLPTDMLNISLISNIVKELKKVNKEFIIYYIIHIIFLMVWGEGLLESEKGAAPLSLVSVFESVLETKINVIAFKTASNISFVLLLVLLTIGDPIQ